MNDNSVIEYDTFPEGNGWTVFNVKTRRPALWNGVWQSELPLSDAIEMVDLLNRMEALVPGSSVA